jgi:hypothetical protein
MMGVYGINADAGKMKTVHVYVFAKDLGKLSLL